MAAGRPRANLASHQIAGSLITQIGEAFRQFQYPMSPLHLITDGHAAAMTALGAMGQLKPKADNVIRLRG